MLLITLILLTALFACIVVGGFWVIGRAGFPRIVTYVWGGIVMIILLIVLVNFSSGNGLNFNWNPNVRLR